MPYGAEVSGWKVLAQRLWSRRAQPYPWLAEVLSAALTLSSDLHRQRFEAAHQGSPITWLQPELDIQGLFGAPPDMAPKVAQAVQDAVHPVLAKERARRLPDYVSEGT